jgi:hypothetical protein
MKKIFPLYFITLVLSSCATSYIKPFGEYYSDSSINPIKLSNLDKAIVIIYKKGVNATNNYAGSNVEIELDNVNVGDLDEGTYFILPVSGGEHEISAIVPFMQRPINAMKKFNKKTITKQFVKGEVYYLNYKINAEPMTKTLVFYQYSADYENTQKTNSVEFLFVDSIVAKKEIMGCREMIEFD